MPQPLTQPVQQSLIPPSDEVANDCTSRDSGSSLTGASRGWREDEPRALVARATPKRRPPGRDAPRPDGRCLPRQFAAAASNCWMVSPGLHQYSHVSPWLSQVPVAVGLIPQPLTQPVQQSPMEPSLEDIANVCTSRESGSSLMGSLWGMTGRRRAGKGRGLTVGVG